MARNVKLQGPAAAGNVAGRSRVQWPGLLDAAAAATAAAAFSPSPGSSTAAAAAPRRREPGKPRGGQRGPGPKLRSGCGCGSCGGGGGGGPSTATLYVPSTPPHTPSLLQRRHPLPARPPARSALPSLDWSRDKSNGKRRAGTLPADPGRDRTSPEAFPRLEGAPNPPPPPRAPPPDFRKLAKNSPHEFSCPADPRWRRIHRGGCWEQDLYPLTPAVTPVAPTPLEGGGDGGCSSRSRRASEARRMDGTPPVRQSTVRSTTLAWSLPGLPPPPAEGAALSCGGDRGEWGLGGLSGLPKPDRRHAGSCCGHAWSCGLGSERAGERGLGGGEKPRVAWVRPPGDAQRVCVCVFLGHPAPEHLLRAVPGLSPACCAARCGAVPAVLRSSHRPAACATWVRSPRHPPHAARTSRAVSSPPLEPRRLIAAPSSFSYTPFFLPPHCICYILSFL